VGPRSNNDDDTKIVRSIPALPDEDAADRTAIQPSAVSEKLIAATADDTGPTLSVPPMLVARLTVESEPEMELDWDEDLIESPPPPTRSVPPPLPRTRPMSTQRPPPFRAATTATTAATSTPPAIPPMRKLTPSAIDIFKSGDVRTRMDTPRMDPPRADPSDRSSLTPLSMRPFAITIAPSSPNFTPLPPAPQNEPSFAALGSRWSRVPPYVVLSVGIAIGGVTVSAATVGAIVALRSSSAEAEHSPSNAAPPPAESNLDRIAPTTSGSAPQRPVPAPRP
jgi:hypothetical protein